MHVVNCCNCTSIKRGISKLHAGMSSSFLNINIYFYRITKYLKCRKNIVIGTFLYQWGFQLISYLYCASLKRGIKLHAGMSSSFLNINIYQCKAYAIQGQSIRDWSKNLLSDDDFEIKSKIYSLMHLLVLLYSYFELQDVFILRILFLFINICLYRITKYYYICTKNIVIGTFLYQ